jgi:methylthioribose-1-phosphate isomerase
VTGIIHAMERVQPVEWADGIVRLIDQTQLPFRYVIEEYDDWRDVAEAIRVMKVRGAPAIGIAAAYGLALAARQVNTNDPETFRQEMMKVCDAFASTRPTAVNLFGAIERIQKVLKQVTSPDEAREAILESAHRLLQEDYEADLQMAEHGANLIKNGFGILTICHTGALATGGYGTALGILRMATEQGKRIHVYACETRPRLQGMRLTAWELQQVGVPFSLITDGMAGFLMAQGKVDCVIVGADRIVANGDTANKIGTYNLAVLADYHDIPFYVAAPLTTVDLSKQTGAEIPVEFRDETEMTHIGGLRIAPEGVQVWNPAFDITPARLITGIITERGIAYPPYREWGK